MKAAGRDGDEGSYLLFSSSYIVILLYDRHVHRKRARSALERSIEMGGRKERVWKEGLSMLDEEGFNALHRPCTPSL